VDSLNRRTEYTYDSAGHVLKQTNLAVTPHPVWTYTYEPGSDNWRPSPIR
jgi:hypothetical protein